jgi:hypothetical protein
LAADRPSGLKKSLVDLDAFSVATTRRLDDTYYGILEKLGTLQSTIISIKELAGMSQETSQVFKADSQGLVAEIESQLDAFGKFDEQQKRIESLQSRIYAGREKVEKLSGRVDIVRERVEGWERADREWQERTRKRLKVVWIITSTVALAMVLLFVGAQYAPTDVGTMKEKFNDMMSSNNTRLPVPGDNLPSARKDFTNNNSVSEHFGEDVRAALNRTRGDGPSVDDMVIRAFDEL